MVIFCTLDGHFLHTRFVILNSFPDLQGEVFVNGVLLDSVKNWFVLNSGYVRQLAVSFYSELTVRQNLLLAMTMQSQKGQSTFQILERVEQVIQEASVPSNE